MKFFYKTFFISFLFISCSSMDEMPRFVSIFRGEIESVKLTSYTQEKNNNVRLSFDKNIEELSTYIFFEEDEEEKLPCIVQKENEDNKNFLVCIEEICTEENKEIAIGQNYYVQGEAKDKWGNSLSFLLPFIGANNNPATLKISEVRPLYSKKPKGEFIEMLVTKDGNLSGIKILNVGSKKEPDYIFPPAEVKKGELVVYHWRTFEEVGAKDELNSNIVAKASGASPHARDFWSKHKSLPRRKNNAIVIEENGMVQDAILYFDSKLEEDYWSSEEIANAAEKAFQSGIWTPSCDIKDAIRYHITPTSSLGRRVIPSSTSNAKQYVLYKSKQVSEGRRNR